MVCRTEGIRAVAPARWRSLDGVMGVFWDAEGDRGARASYLSPDPRIVIFFNDVSGEILMSGREGAEMPHARPMARAIYVPAGVPLWTRFRASHRFSHLDLHLHQDRLIRMLTPALGRSEARTAVGRPVEVHDAAAVETLANLLVGELAAPSRHAVFAESLVAGIVTGLLDLPAAPGGEPAGETLSDAQMRLLVARVDSRSDRRLPVAEMAGAVGLTETRFGAAFKRTTGKTPLQWQLARRIERAQSLVLDGDLSLAAIAIQLGFADQAHLTRAFRQFTGETPAAWRRLQHGR